MSGLDDSQLELEFSRLRIQESQAIGTVDHVAEIIAEPVEEEEEEVGGPFYVHIDILYNAQSDIARSINSYMLRRFYFDPRRYFNFFDVVFDPITPTLTAMRTACGGMSRNYYELWKVKSDFSVADFFAHLENSGFTNTALRIVCMYDGDHQIFRKEF